MEIPLNHLCTALIRCPGEIASLLRRSADPGQRVVRLAELVRSLWPSLPLYACWLGEASRVRGCVLDEAGQPRPDWEEVLTREFGSRRQSSETAVGAFPLPPGLGFANHVWVAEEFAFGNQGHGLLAAVLPGGEPSETVLAGRTLLATLGRHLASQLTIEFLERERQAAEGEASLADLGELAGPVFHEVNNFLNTLLLEVVILGPVLPEKSRPRLQEIRRQGNEVAALIKQSQQYRRGRRPEPQPLDLNQLIGEVIETLGRGESGGNGPSPGRIAILWQPAPHLPAVPGNASALKRLFSFLIKNAAASQGPEGGPVVVRTEARGESVWCHVDDQGPSVPPESLLRFFEPSTPGREGTNRLELAACASILRRLQGKIEAINRPEGGVTVTVELPAAGLP